MFVASEHRTFICEDAVGPWCACWIYNWCRLPLSTWQMEMDCGSCWQGRPCLRSLTVVQFLSFLAGFPSAVKCAALAISVHQPGCFNIPADSGRGLSTVLALCPWGLWLFGQSFQLTHCSVGTVDYLWCAQSPMHEQSLWTPITAITGSIVAD